MKDQLSPMQVLLAEDNPADVFLVREAFRLHQIEVALTVFNDGEVMCRHMDAIDAQTVPCPHIVLLDLNLPRVNGHDLLGRVRQSPLCRSVPVVIVSSSDAPRDKDEATRLGATRYFSKPADFDGFMKLGMVVRELVENGRQ